MPLLPGGVVARMEAPFAVLAVHAAGGRIVRIEYLERGVALLPPQDPLTREACAQIAAYLRDPGFRFDLPLEIRGTAHQCRVWEAIRAIPAGRTRAYGEVAKACASSPRAVGTACGRNRLPLVIPCHRVVGADGIGGFMGSRDGAGIPVKRWLLAHERQVS